MLSCVLCRFSVSFFVYFTTTILLLLFVPRFNSLLLRIYDYASVLNFKISVKIKHFLREKLKKLISTLKQKMTMMIIIEYSALIIQLGAIVFGIYFDFGEGIHAFSNHCNNFAQCNHLNHYNHCNNWLNSMLNSLLKFILKSEETALIGKDQAGIFISILATIFTIHIALWALISGTLDKEYMGIYYAEYIFNLKPHVYKQKMIMISSFIFLIASYFCYIFMRYNLVGVFLFCEIISIAMSTMFIYGIFKNQEAIKDGILMYSLEKHFEADSEKPSKKTKTTKTVKAAKKAKS